MRKKQMFVSVEDLMMYIHKREVGCMQCKCEPCDAERAILVNLRESLGRIEQRSDESVIVHPLPLYHLQPDGTLWCASEDEGADKANQDLMFRSNKKTCYQCEKEVDWLAPDSRCGDCTGYTVDEIRGS